MKTVAPNQVLACALRAVADALEQTPAVLSADELRPIVKFAKEWELEAKGLVRAAKAAGYAVRLGRELVARRSDLLRLVDVLREQQSKASARIAPASDDPYASLVAGAKLRAVAGQR